MIQYPKAVSRTLDPNQRSLLHVTALHDHKLSDADINLIQDLQDFKLRRLLQNQTVSGCLSYTPLVFHPSAALTFAVPAFDALFNGEVVRVGGNGTADVTQNVVTVPAPIFYGLGSAAPPASIYVVFIEFWYQRLSVGLDTGSAPIGYAVMPSSGGLAYYPQGCVNAAAANYIPNDTIDPFMGSSTVNAASAVTTERVQVQWAIRVQSVDLSYDFSTLDYGMDAGPVPTQAIFGQAGQSSLASGTSSQFSKMGPINGDSGLWRSGDGNPLGQLGTMDGYSYAMPLALVFQRNTGAFVIDQNPFGCASITVPLSGTLATTVSGRYDSRFADVVYPEDTIDTRSTITLGSGPDQAILLRRSFVDLISGKTQAIGRGMSPGNLPTAMGSQLDYFISVAPTAIANTDTVGAFDGFMNGFSSADSTYYATKAISVNDKSVGQVGRRWVAGDAVTLALPTGSGASIAYVQVQGLVSDTTNSILTPVLFLGGQIQVTGVGTRSVTILFAKNLVGTTYDPGMSPLYLTVGIEYPVGSGLDLRMIPSAVHGGTLIDATSGKTLPVYGISTYEVSTALPALNVSSATAINPEYSNTIFGTRLVVAVAASSGTTAVNSSGTSVTTFTLSRAALNQLTGLYVISANDQATGNGLTIAARAIQADNFILQIQGAVIANFNVTFLAADTAQLAYSAPVKGVTALEETVLAGSATGDPTLVMDSRVAVVSVKNYPNDHNSVVLATTEASLTGIAGDDVNKLIWVLDNLGNYNAVQVSSALFSNGFVTLSVPATVNLELQPFFVVAAILPAFAPASQLVLAQSYVPYQGEGHAGRDYEVVYTEETALVTTNGTGSAPVPGLRDIYPYNRELPIATMLPSQPTWTDNTLANTPVASYFDSNYAAKRNSNIEHTLEVPVHTNDFIEPIHLDKRKSFQLTTSGGGRGFSKAIPHLGFAIQPLTGKTILASTLSTTTQAVTVYVNNVLGNDANDGLSLLTPVKSIVQALAVLPPVLRHPCTLQLAATSSAYTVTASTTLQTIALGDGDVRSIKYYALGCISFVVQQAGRLVITGDPTTATPIAIDATGFSGFGDGPTSAFFIDNSRVLFNGVNFIGFRDPAIYAIDADVEFVNCQFTNNLTAGSFSQGSSVVVDQGTLTVGNGTGFILSQSDLEASQLVLVVAANTTPNAFFVAERGSSLSLVNHGPTDETNLTAAVLVAEAQLNSSIVCDATFSSQGAALIEKNSVLSRTVSINPFAGGISADTSSSISTAL
jgi:hypothetical protein